MIGKGVYLAGPVSNCNPTQQTAWRKEIRKEIKEKLREKGFNVECLDPTDHEHWTLFEEMVQIDKSDVVIANLWRESIGTVVGIVQARRKGKPVIVIDQNHLKSTVLEQIVGRDLIVGGISEAVNKLPSVFKQFGKQLIVRKSHGKPLEQFEFYKLQDSIHAVCANVHLEDALLPDLVAHEVYRDILNVETSAEIDAERIKKTIFETLSKIARGTKREQEFTQHAEKLREAWKLHEKIKKDQRLCLELMAELQEQLRNEKDSKQALESQSSSLNAENAELKGHIRKLERQPKSRCEVDSERTSELGKDYANYFSSLVFSEHALHWMLSCEKSDRRILEGKFSLINKKQIDGKHEVPGTNPLIWQHDAGHSLRIYFRQETDHRTAILRLGTKGSQDSDYAKLKKMTAGVSR